MSENVSFNGQTYYIPDVGENDWGNNTTNYLVAIASGCLQKTGGSFTLTAEVDFGPTYGLRSVYFRSDTINTADDGVIRLSNADTIAWRNVANDGNNILSVDSSDQLLYNGAPIGSGGVAYDVVFFMGS